MADDTAPVWATAAAAAAGGVAVRQAGRQAAVKNKRENRFLLFYCKCHFIWICLCYCVCTRVCVFVLFVPHALSHFKTHFGHCFLLLPLPMPLPLLLPDLSGFPCAFVIFGCIPKGIGLSFWLMQAADN